MSRIEELEGVGWGRGGEVPRGRIFPGPPKAGIEAREVCRNPLVYFGFVLNKLIYCIVAVVLFGVKSM